MSDNCSSKYRVFVSYSHKDTKLATQVLEHLRRIGVQPMSDQVIPGGTRFSDSIKWQIACSHAFISILTRKSQRSTWVVSELGYAIGAGTAVIPLSLGKMPSGLAHELHAIEVRRNLSDLDDKLTLKDIQNLVKEACKEGRSTSQCVDQLLDRTKLLVDEAESLQRFPRAGMLRVRQRMAFSSFSIPDEPPCSSVWNVRDGSVPRSENERGFLRQERRVMEQHAVAAGCDLILDPYVRIGYEDGKETTELKHSNSMTRVRLEILRNFIRDFPGDDLRVAFNRGQIKGSLIMLGDWLAAEAVVPHYKSGYRQTVITRHAPTLLSRIENFEEELQDSLRADGIVPENSRQAALEKIDQIIDELGDCF